MSALCGLHATASGGQHTLCKLVKLEKTVTCLSDCDEPRTHRRGWRAPSSVSALGLAVVRRVELSARKLHNFHILGHGFRDGDNDVTSHNILCKIHISLQNNDAKQGV